MFDINSITRENIKKMKPYASARSEFFSSGADMVYLDANENPFENGVNRYPDPQQRSLKVELASQKGISAKNILLGNGSDEILDLIFRAFCEPRVDNIITLPPTFGMFKVLAGLNDVENRQVVLTNKLQLDVQGVVKAIDERTKVIFICSPNNPTGNSFNEEHIIRLLENFDGLVVLDEAYIHFSKKKSWVLQLEEYPNLVVVQTLSKAYGLAGIRLGICMASEEIIAVLDKIKLPYNVNELTQKRALIGILNKNSIKEEIDCILNEKDSLLKELNQVYFIEKCYPSDTNFVLVKVDNANKRYKQLLDEGIVVRNRTSQVLCENTLRFTVGTPNENIKLIEVLKSLV
ncbi:Histidinol-phosphate aminotransferase [hydrothermal vent metagenome]|uniref:Histidinol-phosphate aminotransferase n=1 Tax=hydrothermal vent metagenome TaxID=652676 RepID=A0A3B0TQV3_9ZZZZ